MRTNEIDIAALDHALDMMFEAAIAPDRWIGVLDGVCRATGSIGAHIVPLTERFDPGVPATPSVMEAMDAYFREGWDQRDIRFSFARYVQSKGVAVEHDHVSESEMNRLPYYNDFLGRHGFRYSCMVGFYYGTNLLSFGLQRGVGDQPFDRNDERILVRMQSRLTTAMQVFHGLQSAKQVGMSEAFDMASLACAFFDRHGRVTRINQRAEKLLGSDIRLSNGEFLSRTTAETVALRNHLKAVLDRRPLTDQAASSPVMFSREGKRPVVFRIQRLAGAAAGIFSHTAAVAVITDLGMKSTLPSNALRRMFSLTAQEEAMASHLGNGVGAKEIADVHELNYETVRTHVKSVMRKMGASRQSEIVALLARLNTV
ncbi:helix-turn-helix transcriptional regulator (plasmid) [Rhizobium sp. CB3171]|uniref:helix-turn-helix transcriptional regulator n=1 Tax=Rhizobium sp. CB3171 TaxID=3039157 RepID=UPI0024B1369B|nr:helix-turn-helix transcriptional regulator [Rhizobium sp. CB3171]WFU07444.1 helix-turn-helix transcriptional regulator [Rhizobium sp. CB3171]